MNDTIEFIKIDLKKKGGKARLYVVEFIDNGFMVAYNQSLNLSGYGKTSGEAKEMLFKEVLMDFFENLFQQTPTIIYETLHNLGWQRSPFFKQELSKTALIDREGILRNFNLPIETEMHGELVNL
jgi:hypothetical protein